MSDYEYTLDRAGNIKLDRRADEIAREAIRIARRDGCDCQPDVEVTPTGKVPWWFPVVRHDAWCALKQRVDAEAEP